MRDLHTLNRSRHSFLHPPDQATCPNRGRQPRPSQQSHERVPRMVIEKWKLEHREFFAEGMFENEKRPAQILVVQYTEGR